MCIGDDEPKSMVDEDSLKTIRELLMIGVSVESSY